MTQSPLKILGRSEQFIRLSVSFKHLHLMSSECTFTFMLVVVIPVQESVCGFIIHFSSETNSTQIKQIYPRSKCCFLIGELQ